MSEMRARLAVAGGHNERTPAAAADLCRNASWTKAAEPPGAVAGIHDALAVGKLVQWHAEQERAPAGRDLVIAVFAMTCRNWEHFGCYPVAPFL
jgi:hypothetical protein